MKRKVFIAIAAAMISAFASVSTAQVKTPLPSSQPSKSVPALSEEQIKRLIQAETEKKDALRGQAEAERKFDTTMTWVQVLLAGVSALAITPLFLGFILLIFRKSILGQLTVEATKVVQKQVEAHLRPTIDKEVEDQIWALFEKKFNQRMQEFEAAVPASNQETPSPEKLSQIDELRRRFEDLQDLLPTMMMPSAEYYFKQGNVLCFEKQYEQAIASYDKAIKIKSDYFEAHFSRGVALGDLGRYEEAIASYDEAIKIKPDYFEAYSNRGVALGNLGRHEEEIASYDKAIKIKPDYSEAFYNRGLGLVALNRYEEAITSYDKALLFNPNHSDTSFNRACSYALQGKVEETVHALKKAIELDSTYREKAKTDSDFDKVRQDERFQKLLKDES